MSEEMREDAILLLEGVGWKRRSGFLGKYSSWERRRFALDSSANLSYYKVIEGIPESQPRGTLSILPEHAVVTVSYPGDVSNPTPYALTIKTTDEKGSDSIKWKFCFDDRETQLVWLAALTDIVAEANVEEISTNTAGLNEKEGRKLLHLVHDALVLGDGNNQNKRKRVHGNGTDGTTKDASLTVGEITVASAIATSPISTYSQLACFDSVELQGNNLPVKRLYHAAAIVLVSFIYETHSEKSSLFLWKMVSITILCICFAPTANLKVEKKEGSVSEPASIGSVAEQNKPTLPNEKSLYVEKNTDDTGTDTSPLKEPSVTKVMVETALMKSEGVPLSHMPSIDPDDGGETHVMKQADPKADPITADDMGAHLHERWAVSAPNVDISGQWTLIADDTFKHEYDAYLKQLGFSGITRKVACSLISRTAEITKQSDNGRALYLKGTNPKGAWERTLIASGYPEIDTHLEQKEGGGYTHLKTSIKTADSEEVDAEAWWEERGTKHRSWLRGGKKYGGGDFESLRYFMDGSGDNVLVCESTFHPKDALKERAKVTWKFQRNEKGIDCMNK